MANTCPTANLSQCKQLCQNMLHPNTCAGFTIGTKPGSTNCVMYREEA